MLTGCSVALGPSSWRIYGRVASNFTSRPPASPPKHCSDLLGRQPDSRSRHQQLPLPGFNCLHQNAGASRDRSRGCVRGWRRCRRRAGGCSADSGRAIPPLALTQSAIDCRSGLAPAVAVAEDIRRRRRWALLNSLPARQKAASLIHGLNIALSWRWLQIRRVDSGGEVEVDGVVTFEKVAALRALKSVGA